LLFGATKREPPRQLRGSARTGRLSFWFILCVGWDTLSTAGYDIPLDGDVLGENASTQSRDPGCPSPGSLSLFHDPLHRKKLMGVVDPITKELIEPRLHHHSLIAELGQRIVRFREFVVFDGSRVFPEYVVAYKRAPKPERREPEPEPEPEPEHEPEPEESDADASMP
jgi:hypothetical protein